MSLLFPTAPDGSADWRDKRGDTVNTAPVLCKKQDCAGLSERLLLPIDWCFDCKSTPLLPLKLSLVYLFYKSHLGPWPFQGWLGFYASGCTEEKNRWKVWRCSPVPCLPLNCCMTLDGSLLPFEPQILPLHPMSDPRGVDDSVILISRLPAPMGCSMNCLRQPLE